MDELKFFGREADEHLEYLEEEELSVLLEEFAPRIGWIIIKFNSLERVVAWCIGELVSRDPFQDERISVFLSEMQYSGICRALINLYGQAISFGALKIAQEELVSLENTLVEAGKRRNEYAHGDWVGAKSHSYVCVKTQAKKIGIMERYRRFDVDVMEADEAFIHEAIGILEEFHEKVNEELYRSSRSPASHSDAQHSALARAWLRHVCPSKRGVLSVAYLGVRRSEWMSLESKQQALPQLVIPRQAVGI